MFLYYFTREDSSFLKGVTCTVILFCLSEKFEVFSRFYAPFSVLLDQVTVSVGYQFCNLDLFR